MPTWVGSPNIGRRSAFVVALFLISAPGLGDGKSRPVDSALHAASETANTRKIVSAARRCRIAGLLVGVLNGAHSSRAARAVSTAPCRWRLGGVMVPDSQPSHVAGTRRVSPP